jgi:hypothetical protein
MSDNPAKRTAILLLLLGLFAVVAAAVYWFLSSPAGQKPVAEAPGKFGALATSQSSLNFGSSWGYHDEASANQRAVAECNARLPAADCVVRLNVGGTCGALVVSESKGQSIVVNDADKTLAGALALAQCQANGVEDCVLRHTFCGDGS